MRHILTALMCLVVLAGGLPVSTTSAQSSGDIETELIAALNAWRVEEAGLWPLKPNATLDMLATQHAEYLLGLPSIPDDIHAGPGGSRPKDRARAAGWPVYGRSTQIAIGENAKIGPGVEDAINWWKGSTTHHNTVVNPAYREVGVAMLPHEYGYLTIVVFGARPNVLPAFHDPVEGVIRLSNEHFRAASLGEEWIYRATQIRLYDSSGEPLGDWREWRSTIPVPENAGEQIAIEFTDGTQQVRTTVDLQTDLAILPSVLAAQAESPAAPASATTIEVYTRPNAASVVLPTITPHTTAPTDIPATPAPTSTPFVAPTITPAPSSTPFVAPTSTPDVLIHYDDQSLSLINVSGEALDMTGLAFVHGMETFAVTRWQAPWLGAPLNAIPAGDCLQVWAWSEQGELPKPGECRYRLGVLNIAPEDRFWVGGGFAIMRNGAILVTCPVATGTCEVTLR